MTHEIHMGEDGLLRIAFTGDLDLLDMNAFLKDFNPFRNAATPEAPLNFILDSGQTGRYASAARKFFAELNRDPRVGKIGVINPTRYTRVLVPFILKATQRDNIQFLDSEAECVVWLKNHRKPVPTP